MYGYEHEGLVVRDWTKRYVDDRLQGIIGTGHGTDEKHMRALVMGQALHPPWLADSPNIRTILIP